MITGSAFLARRQPPGRAPRKEARYRDGLVVMLAVTTGAIDAVTYLRLGRVFSSVITGNLVLLGVAAGQHYAGFALNGGLALAGYGVGVIVGGAVAGPPDKDQPTWPRQVTVTLILELVLLAGFSGGWLALGEHPSGVPRLALLAVAAAGMGMQATAVRRLGPMSTTYLTSTLTGVLQALAIRRLPSEWQRSTGVLAAAVIGACLGALAALRAPPAVPAVVIVPLAAVVACSALTLAKREASGHPGHDD